MVSAQVRRQQVAYVQQRGLTKAEFWFTILVAILLPGISQRQPLACFRPNVLAILPGWPFLSDQGENS
jgi:hypothetical protein